MNFYYEMPNGDVLLAKPDIVYRVTLDALPCGPVGPSGPSTVDAAVRGRYRLALVVNGATGVYFFKTEDAANKERQKLIDHCRGIDNETDAEFEAWLNGEESETGP